MDFHQEHHVDLRIQKTRAAIINTFQEMICEMPAEKITIKELTDRAKLKPPYSHKEANRVFFTYYSQQKEYVQRLVCEPSYRSFCNKLHSATLQHNRSRHNPYAAFSPEKQNIINTFLVANSLEMYSKIIQQKKRHGLCVIKKYKPRFHNTPRSPI